MHFGWRQKAHIFHHRQCECFVSTCDEVTKKNIEFSLIALKMLHFPIFFMLWHTSVHQGQARFYGISHFIEISSIQCACVRVDILLILLLLLYSKLFKLIMWMQQRTVTASTVPFCKLTVKIPADQCGVIIAHTHKQSSNESDNRFLLWCDFY